METLSPKKMSCSLISFSFMRDVQTYKDNYDLSAYSPKGQTDFLMRNMQASIHFIYGYCNGNNTRHRETGENKSQMTEQLEIPQTLFNEIFLERVTNHLCASEWYGEK